MKLINQSVNNVVIITNMTALAPHQQLANISKKYIASGPGASTLLVLVTSKNN